MMKHLSITNWLTQLGLPEYCVLFDEQYDDVEDLLHLTEVDLRKMGIENQIHRRHILSNILLLQEAERTRAPSAKGQEGRMAKVYCTPNIPTTETVHWAG